MILQRWGLTAVILVNVLGFYDRLRDLIDSIVVAGFIRPQQRSLITFVDGPPRPDGSSSAEQGQKYIEEHRAFDWGKAVSEAMEEWRESSAETRSHLLGSWDQT